MCSLIGSLGNTVTCDCYDVINPRNVTVEKLFYMRYAKGGSSYCYLLDIAIVHMIPEKMLLAVEDVEEQYV